MYYLGGYFLISLKPFDWVSLPEKRVFTCTTCINASLLETWSFAWVDEPVEQTAEAKERFGLNTAQVVAIRHWTGQKHREGKIGWHHIFAYLETVLDYQQKFFTQVADVKIMALYFDEQAADRIIRGFESPFSRWMRESGLAQVLAKKVPETKTPDETTIGYDLIGIEEGGSFHSFHCHGISTELSEKFGLTLNSFGLFDDADDWQPVLDYLNHPENGCEPVPWLVAKTNLIHVE